MIVKTVEEKVQQTMLKYLYDTADDFTCMRLMAEILPVVGARSGLSVFVDTKTDAIEVSYTDTRGTLHRFMLANGQIRHFAKN